MNSNTHLILALVSPVSFIVMGAVLWGVCRRLKASQAEKSLRDATATSLARHILFLNSAFGDLRSERDELKELLGNELDAHIEWHDRAMALKTERDALRARLTQPRGRDGKFVARERADG